MQPSLLHQIQNLGLIQKEKIILREFKKISPYELSKS
jgi:hypothetical protein